MSLIDDINEEPWRFDFYSVLRRIERSFADRPRIGDSASLRDEYVALGQDPYMDFPASNLRRFSTSGTWRWADRLPIRAFSLVSSPRSPGT